MTPIWKQTINPGDRLEAWHHARPNDKIQLEVTKLTATQVVGKTLDAGVEVRFQRRTGQQIAGITRLRQRML